MDVLNFLRNAVNAVGINAKLLIAGKGLARELEKDAFECSGQESD
jgi:hypothetical protein